MKKSAIYLGASAAILAIAGAFTTKSATRVVNYTAYTAGCNTTKVTCSNSSQVTCKTSGINHNTLYTACHGAKLHTGA